MALKRFADRRAVEPLIQMLRDTVPLARAAQDSIAFAVVRADWKRPRAPSIGAENAETASLCWPQTADKVRY